MKTCIFLGPSMDCDSAREILDGTYLPPVRQGDLLRAIDAHKPDTIAIIDGFFEQTPAVWHKEILWAMAHGIAVCGASSMGALRAAELDGFGMVGCGRIYQAYRDGVFDPYTEQPFEDDDEVAVSHGPAELGYLGSVALVDMRATLAAACDQKIINAATRNALAASAKAIFYKDRTYEELLARAFAKNKIGPKFAEWLQDGGKVHQKRLDAEKLLALIASNEHNSSIAKFNFEHTMAWDSALASVGSSEGLA